jgi:hypothetical protein
MLLLRTFTSYSCFNYHCCTAIVVQVVQQW